MRKSYIFIGVIVAVILVGLGLAGKWISGMSSKVFVTPADNYPVKQEAKSPVLSFLEDKTPVNVLIMGYGGEKHDGTYLTDTMIVANIDPIKKRITMISIPRDIWVKTNDQYAKINSIYQNGRKAGGESTGGNNIKEAVSVVTGLPINYFAGIDFDGFIKGIDILGGVDVKVDVTFDDNQYPIKGMENELCGHTEEELVQITATASATREPQLIFPCRYENLHFDAGTVHMDGATALKYVRSRHSVQDGNDFGRSRRQKNLILAVKQKILAVNFIPKIIPFVTSLGNNFRTDLNINEAAKLLQNAAVLSKYQIISLALTDDNYLESSYSPDGQYILIPIAGQDNYTEIHNYLSDELNTPATPSTAVVMVKNGTTIKGLAQKAILKLKERKIQTVSPVNADNQTQTKTTMMVYDDNINSEQLAAIKEVFGINQIENATLESELNYNILIILGQDYGN